MAEPFNPHYGTTQIQNSTTSSQSASIDPQDTSVSLLVRGTQTVFVRIGEGAQTATTADQVIAPEIPTILRKAPGADTIAWISTSTGSALVFSTGKDGI